MSAADLIRDAVRAGEIDEATGYLYRFYAQWGDPQLPERYRGARIEDLALTTTAGEFYDGLPLAQQQLLQPFIVRPTHDASYWATARVPASASNGMARLVVALVNDPRCNAGLWARRDLATHPVTIWARCRVRQDGSTELVLVDELDRIERAMNRFWGPMTTLMGVPLPDRFARSSRGPLEVLEAGDGRLDIYVVEAPNVPYGRDLESKGRSAAIAVPQWVDGASASYMVIDPRARTRPFALESVVAHEFFHVLQASHERAGTVVCPYPNVTTMCSANDLTHHWFVEASASWAEHEFVPEARPANAHPLFETFLRTAVSLADTTGENEYSSFMWPLFMEQESPRGPAAVADAWRAIESASGWTAVQAAVDAQVPSESKFREFAVRVWNEELLPGDPITPRFRDPRLDPVFPTTIPVDAEPASRYEDQIDLRADLIDFSTVDLPEVWAGYYDVRIPADAKRLTLNFAGLNPNDKLDVDALVKVHDVGWERRMLDSQVTEWCLDRPADAIEAMILVLSNHSQTPSQHIKGNWSAKAESAGCLTASDSLVYTLTRETGSPGDPFTQTLHETLTLRLKLKAAPPDSPYGAEFLNDGSTYDAEVDTNTFLAGVPGANCDGVSVGHAFGSGPVPGDDGVTANVQEDFVDPPPNSSIVPIGHWIMSVSAGIPLDMTTVQSGCAGTETSTSKYVVQLPVCDGFEVATGGAANRLFEFNCNYQGPGESWSVVGKLRVVA